MIGNISGRVVFLHIPKTAGSAVRESMERCAQKLFLFSTKGVPASMDGCDLISGHFGYGFASGSYVTVLRNPIDRALSHYGQHCRNNDEPRGLTLEQWLDACPRQWRNLQVRWLCGIETEWHYYAMARPGPVDDLGEEHLQAALANLKTFRAVGVHENLAPFLADIGIPPLKQHNVHERLRREDVSPETLQRIVEGNTLDERLWRTYAGA